MDRGPMSVLHFAGVSSVRASQCPRGTTIRESLRQLDTTMSVWPILEKRHRHKQIQVTKYANRARGVEIQVTHNVPTQAGKSLRWVQTVTANNDWSKTCGATRVDPFGFGSPSIHKFPAPGMPASACKADDLKPFYWTDAEFSGGSGPGFSDKPGTPVPATGRRWTQFVLALTEVDGNHVHHLVAIYWGYDRMASGEIRVAAIRRPTTKEMQNHGMTLKKLYPGYRYT